MKTHTGLTRSSPWWGSLMVSMKDWQSELTLSKLKLPCIRKQWACLSVWVHEWTTRTARRRRTKSRIGDLSMNIIVEGEGGGANVKGSE